MTNVIINCIHGGKNKGKKTRYNQQKHAIQWRNIHVQANALTQHRMNQVRLNNNLRINKFRAKMSTYYLRTFIKCFGIIISSGSSNRDERAAAPHDCSHNDVEKAKSIRAFLLFTTLLIRVSRTVHFFFVVLDWSRATLCGCSAIFFWFVLHLYAVNLMMCLQVVQVVANSYIGHS